MDFWKGFGIDKKDSGEAKLGRQTDTKLKKRLSTFNYFLYFQMYNWKRVMYQEKMVQLYFEPYITEDYFWKYK